MGLNFYNTVGGREFVDHTMPAIKKSLESIEKFLSNTMLHNTSYTTTVRYGSEVIVIRSDTTTSDDVVDIARATKESFSKWDDNVENWRKAFVNLLPKDCKVIGREIRL